VAFKKSANSAGPKVWSVAELGAFYTENRAELLAHANRVLKDGAKAEEITQDALIKFMLAAPELESREHAIAYLHRTIENLCIDFFRAEGRRPNLVVIDDAQAEVEATWQDNGDHAEALSAAEDAAIIPQDLPNLFELILAANFLDIRALLDLACKTLAKKFEYKTEAQIKELFEITDDFTQQEIDEIIAEFPWLNAKREDAPPLEE